MARALVVEDDPVFAALLEDRMHVAGHEVDLATDGAQAVALAAERPVDLVLLDMSIRVASGMDVLRALRAQAESSALPILVLSEEVESPRRVAALRAGADDFLTKPCDFEELMLRVDRLLGVRSFTPMAFQGDLEVHPIWEVLQYVSPSDGSGFLVVQGRAGSGRVRVKGGQVIGARFRNLTDREALLAIAGMKQGRFRFVSQEPDDTWKDREPLPVARLLMQAAWLEDELERRREHIPPTGAPLEIAGPLPDEATKLEPEGLPLREILACLEQTPGQRLYDLLALGIAAPQKVRLTVARLREWGTLGLLGESLGAGDYPSTTEISTHLVLDAALNEMLLSASGAGLESSSASYLLLAEPGVWPEIESLFEAIPGSGRDERLGRLRRQFKLRRGGSTTFEVEAGKLSLHIQELTATNRAQVEAVVPVCAGIVLWLDRADPPEVVERVVRRLEEKKGPSAGVLVAASEEARRIAARLTRGAKRWQVSPQPPLSFVGLLRLLRAPR